MVKKVVIKLGTGILSAGKGKIHEARLAKLANGIHAVGKSSKTQVIVVSSGAVGLGMGKLGLDSRPTDLAILRACAAIGQCLLMNAWTDALRHVGLVSAQVLLTRDDFNERARSQKVQETLDALLAQGVIPIVNENDSVSDEEIKFGDNDVLSALLCSLGKANLLVILSTAKGLMTHPEAGSLVPFVAEITPAIEQMAKGTDSPTAVGGMVTKIEAAKIATKSGCAVFIGSGEQPSELSEIINGQAIGTFFAPAGLELRERKRWLAFFPKPKGRISIDDGARNAILTQGGSLLASGLLHIEGEFEKAEVVSIIDSRNQTIARGITRFSSAELLEIRGKSNSEVLDLHPGKTRPEVVHRDHLAPHVSNPN